MNPARLDTISRFFGARRSRRRALAQAGAGIAATLGAAGLARQAAAQDTTPAVPPPTGNEEPVFLFLQAFQAGSVAAKEGGEGRYTLTLEQGLGHTIYFSDRPDRIVGAAPTIAFLDGLGFPDDNPPNAALVVETADGQTEIAVLELFDPSYDEATRTATYEVAVLAEWERTGQAGGSGFTETNADLAAFGSAFGAAHLFIDDCADATIQCYKECGSDPIGNLGNRGMCWSWDDWTCHPCDGDWDGTALECFAAYPSCGVGCFTHHWSWCGTP